MYRNGYANCSKEARMTTISVLLACFLGIGLFTRSWNNRTRVLVSGAIIVMLVYLYLT